MRRTEEEKARINYLNSREYWKLKGARGVYTKDHNEIAQMWKRLEKAGIDPSVMELLGPECLLEESPYNHLHKNGDYWEWLKKKGCDKV